MQVHQSFLALLAVLAMAVVVYVDAPGSQALSAQNSQAVAPRVSAASAGLPGVELRFAADGIRRLAEIAWSVNESTENIGARRLHTVMERLLEHVSFEAADKGGSVVSVDAAFVDRHLGELARDEDLSRYIL